MKKVIICECCKTNPVKHTFVGSPRIYCVNCGLFLKQYSNKYYLRIAKLLKRLREKKEVEE